MLNYLRPQILLTWAFAWMLGLAGAWAQQDDSILLHTEIPYPSPADYEKQEKLAVEGDAQSQYLIGRALLEGWPVKKNEVRAYLFLEQASSQGNLKALNSLAIMKMTGIGIEQNVSSALEFFEQVANQGLAEAQYNMSVIYFNALGFDPYVTI